MIRIEIVALTKKGEDAITDHVLKMQKARAKKLMAKKMGFSFGVTSNPKTLYFELNGFYLNLVNPKHLKQQLTDDMKESGCILNKDFKVLSNGR